jgi:hypothetical protein
VDNAVTMGAAVKGNYFHVFSLHYAILQKHAAVFLIVPQKHREIYAGKIPLDNFLNRCIVIMWNYRRNLRSSRARQNMMPHVPRREVALPLEASLPSEAGVALRGEIPVLASGYLPGYVIPGPATGAA